LTDLPRIADDSGFLALVDPDSYEGFLGDWDYDSIMVRFREAMASRSLLLWHTGHGGFWQVAVSDPAPASGFRRTAGPIRSAKGRLLITNYESLTMAAQFEDVRLPEPHLADLLIEVAPGDHTCEVTQVYDPADGDLGDGAHFVLTLTPGGTLPAWKAPAWPG
jgi:hypothetical protein